MTKKPLESAWPLQAADDDLRSAWSGCRQHPPREPGQFLLACATAGDVATVAGGRFASAPAPSRETAPAVTSLEPVETTRPLAKQPTTDWRGDADAIVSNFRHSGWQRLRDSTYAALRETGAPDARLARFAECGSNAWLCEDRNQPGRYRVVANHCHDRFCVACTSAKARGLGQSVSKMCEGRTVRMITLTLKNTGESLEPVLNRLYKSFATLRRRSFWIKAVDGGVAFLECKFNASTNRWHPHLHVLVVGRFVHHGMLKRAWNVITEDSFIVDVRYLRGSQDGARYAAKYAGKPLSHTYKANPSAFADAIRTLKGRRLIMAFGEFRGMLVTERDDDTEWVNLGPLYEWIWAADSGDPNAQRVVNSIRRHNANPERAGPQLVLWA